MENNNIVKTNNTADDEFRKMIKKINKISLKNKVGRTTNQPKKPSDFMDDVRTAKVARWKLTLVRQFDKNRFR